MGEHAAVWVPDGEATICMHCNKSQFNVLNRRVSTNMAIAVNLSCHIIFIASNVCLSHETTKTLVKQKNFFFSKPNTRGVIF